MTDGCIDQDRSSFTFALLHRSSAPICTFALPSHVPVSPCQLAPLAAPPRLRRLLLTEAMQGAAFDEE